MIKELPKNLRQMRLKNNLSQSEVAKRLGFSTSIISSYETGERTPSIENLLALSYLYKCSTDYLLGIDNLSSEVLIDISDLNVQQIKAITNITKIIQNA